VAHPLLAALQGLPLPPLGRVQLASAIAPVRAGTVLRPYRLVASGAMTDVAPGPLSEDTPVPVPTPTPETATPTGPEVGSATGTTAEPTPWHGAAMLRGLADADGVIVAPRLGLSAGSSAPCLPLPW
jgi:molybdopterin molybdotransferase